MFAEPSLHTRQGQVAVLGVSVTQPGIWLMIENERCCCWGETPALVIIIPTLLVLTAGPGLVSLTVSLFLPRVLTRKYEQGAEETEAAAAAGLKLGAEQWPGPSIIQASCSLYTSLGSGHSRYCAQK